MAGTLTDLSTSADLRPSASRVWRETGYILLVACAAFASFFASLGIHNAESSTHEAWLPLAILAASTVLVGSVPALATIESFRTCARSMALWGATFVPGLIFMLYAAILWFAAALGSAGADDKRVSVLLTPLYLLAPIAAVFGTAVIAAVAARHAAARGGVS